MKKIKIKIEELKVQSFVTEVIKPGDIVGGSQDTSGAENTGGGTLFVGLCGAGTYTGSGEPAPTGDYVC